MGYRGHVRTLNIIKHGTGAGNHLFGSIAAFLQECSNLFPEFYCDDTEKETWEFERSSFGYLIENLKNITNETRDYLSSIIRKNALLDLGDSEDAFGYIFNCCQIWQQESDINSDYVTVDWF